MKNVTPFQVIEGQLNNVEHKPPRHLMKEVFKVEKYSAILMFQSQPLLSKSTNSKTLTLPTATELTWTPDY